MSMEFALLVDAITPAVPPPPADDAWRRAPGDRLLRTAAWHRVVPMLHRRLLALRWAPTTVRDAIEDAYLANAARNLAVMASLRDAVDALEAAAVPVMLLKGAALLQDVYPDPAVRELLDLDLLVPGDQLEVADAALGAAGFRPESDGGAAPAQEVRAGHHHAAPLVDHRTMTAVELHHHVAMASERRHFPIDDLWRRARPTADGAFLLPSAEDLLLHVCVHFTRNRLGGSHDRRGSGGALAQVGDVAWIVHRERIDWKLLVDVALDYQLHGHVYLALYAAHAVGVPVPASALEALRPAGLDARVARRLVALRVLRDGEHLPVRGLRWIVAPGRRALERGWDADPASAMSMAGAYVRRARVQLPLARSALRRPWTVVADHRLSAQLKPLEMSGEELTSR
jgi:hypothetical protein